MRDHFRAAWPGLFARDDKQWPLFDRLRFNADAYNDYRPDMEWLAARMPHATLCLLKDIGHLPFVETEATFTMEVAAFLNGQRP